MRFFYVDVFTGRTLAGNPLAVFFEEGGLTDRSRQAIAREVGFSETTFVEPRPAPDGSWKVRIFTPDAEIPFAGHPTLGSADVIARHLSPGSDRLVLSLGVGPIPVVRDGPRWVMDQNPPAFEEPQADRARAASLLGLTEADLAPQLPVQFASTGLRCLVLPLRSTAALDRCKVDHREYERWLTEVGPGNLCAFTVGSADPDCALSMRVFVDDTGFAEDPATGSAAGNLSGYLVEHRVLGPEVRAVASQGDQMGRPSRLHLQAWWDEGRIRIRVGGEVVSVARGEWAGGLNR
jgi:trans-2,3-dihydro-3-hydroxyanthranilate isomerase